MHTISQCARQYRKKLIKKNNLQFLTNIFMCFFRLSKESQNILLCKMQLVNKLSDYSFRFIVVKKTLVFLNQFRKCEPKDKSVTRSVAFNEVESSDQSFARVRTGTVLCSCVARTRNTRLVPTLDQLQEMQAFLAIFSSFSKNR